MIIPIILQTIGMLCGFALIFLIVEAEMNERGK